jgi:hypothetical protein
VLERPHTFAMANATRVIGTCRCRSAARDEPVAAL